jgi:hypothetical protein
VPTFAGSGPSLGRAAPAGTRLAGLSVMGHTGLAHQPVPSGTYQAESGPWGGTTIPTFQFEPHSGHRCSVSVSTRIERS